MLKLATPATPPFIPPSRPICFIAVDMQRLSETTKQYMPFFTLLDKDKQPIVVDMKFVPQQPPILTPEQQKAFGDFVTTAKGQTPVQVCSAAAAPIAAAFFGLTGLSVV